MITCNLTGGLGNQLFQIFTTISLSMKTTRIDSQTVDSFRKIKKKRDFGSSVFNGSPINKIHVHP